MNQNTMPGDGKQRSVLLDGGHMRCLVCGIVSDRLNLELPLLKMAGAGSVLAANPASADARKNACTVWRKMIDVIDRLKAGKSDQKQRVARTMLGTLNKLRELDFQISQINFEDSPPDLTARGGEATNKFLVILRDLGARVDGKLLVELPRLAESQA